MTKRWARTPRPITTAFEARLLADLAPRLEQFAADTWVLAQRAPSLAADPALLGEANRLLAAARRLLSREPGHRLLPRPCAPGTGLAALALTLRQIEAAIGRFVARRQPPERDIDDEIDAINQITALVLRDIAGDLAERRDLALPAGLQPLERASEKKLIPAPWHPA
jgi:hypothetical protein